MHLYIHAYKLNNRYQVTGRTLSPDGSVAYRNRYDRE